MLPVALATAAALEGAGAVLIGLGPLALALAGVATVPYVVLALRLARLLRRQSLSIQNGALPITSTLYRRHIPLRDLRIGAARTLGLSEHPGYRPPFRTNALSVTGMASGWYRLRNGERAFVARGGGHRVLWIPGNGVPGLLLEAGRPDAMLAYLREVETGDAQRPVR